MNKNILLVVATIVFGLGLSNIEAGYRRCGTKSCAPSCEVKQCATACRVDKVVENPCPAVPCCVRYVKVEEPALITKHISYSVECPSGCTAEQKAAGILSAGQTIDYNANY